MTINIVNKIDRLVKLRHVLISVSDKTGLEQLVPGLRQINLTVIASNRAAYSLYETCGFEEFGLEREAIAFALSAADVGSATLRLRVQWRQYTGQLCVV